MLMDVTAGFRLDHALDAVARRIVRPRRLHEFAVTAVRVSVAVACFFFRDLADFAVDDVRASLKRHAVHVQAADLRRLDVAFYFKAQAGIANKLPAGSAAGAGRPIDARGLEIERFSLRQLFQS